MGASAAERSTRVPAVGRDRLGRREHSVQLHSEQNSEKQKKCLFPFRGGGA